MNRKLDWVPSAQGPGFKSTTSLNFKRENLSFKLEGEAVQISRYNNFGTFRAELDAKTDLVDLRIEGRLTAQDRITGDQADFKIKPKVKIGPAAKAKIEEIGESLERGFRRILGDDSHTGEAKVNKGTVSASPKNVNNSSSSHNVNVSFKPYLRLNLNPERSKIGVKGSAQVGSVNISGYTAVNPKGKPQAEVTANAELGEKTNVRLSLNYNEELKAKAEIVRPFRIKNFKVNASAYVQTNEDNLAGVRVVGESRDKRKFFFINGSVSERGDFSASAGFGIRF